MSPITSRFTHPTRRQLLQTGAAGLALASGALRAQDGQGQVLRIGYQKSSTLTIYLKSRGILEQALAPLKVQLQWHEFSSGLPLLEALNLRNLDLSADVADAVPPFALAAGAQLSYYASETPSPQAQAIVVKRDSPIQTLAQLKGERIAFAKGAGAHYLLLEALAKAGLSLKDVQPAYLSPADARAAFERGAVAAWVIWDPFLAAVQRQADARVLTDGTGLSNYRRFYLASTPYAQKHPELLAIVYDALVRAGEWVKANPQAAAAWHAPLIGLDADTVLAANARRSYKVQPVDAGALAEQQRIADTFTAQAILPRHVSIQDAGVWKRS